MSVKVFFIKTTVDDGQKIVSQKARKLFQAGGFESCFKRGDFTAVKVHVGEPPNDTYIKAPFVKGLVEELLALKTKPFITDTSALYTGRRHNAIDHTILAYERGFDISDLGIPFIAPDGLFGTSETAVQIDGELNKEVLVASDTSARFVEIVTTTAQLMQSASVTSRPVSTGTNVSVVVSV
jgi:uncharacterized Fe-S center protein